jgi:hypothetical protein
MHRVLMIIISNIILKIYFSSISLRMYAEHFHFIHVYLPSTNVRSRICCERFGIYTENANELLNGQISIRPQGRLAGACKVLTREDYYSYCNISVKQVEYRFYVSEF